MKNIILSLAGLCVLGLLTIAPALAQTATDVNCDGCVQTGDIATNGVRRSDIQNFSINTPKLNNFAVTAAKIKPGAVTADKIADGAITADKLAADADLSNEVSVLQGEQTVQNDRLDSLEDKSDIFDQRDVFRAPTVSGRTETLGTYTLGTYMGLHREGSNNDVVGYIVYTNQGYFFNVYASRNTSASNPPGDMFVTANQGVWYDEPGCSGEGWIPSGVPEGARNYSLVPITQGAVFRHPSGRTFYVAKNVVPAPTGGGVAVAQSQRYMDGSCLASAGHAGQFKIAVLPNDPTVTGVPNETIQRPINLVR